MKINVHLWTVENPLMTEASRELKRPRLPCAAANLWKGPWCLLSGSKVFPNSWVVIIVYFSAVAPCLLRQRSDAVQVDLTADDFCSWVQWTFQSTGLDYPTLLENYKTHSWKHHIQHDGCKRIAGMETVTSPALFLPINHEMEKSRHHHYWFLLTYQQRRKQSTIFALQ